MTIKISGPYSAYKIWFAVFFVGMGLVIPQVSPFVFSHLKIQNPGIVFLSGQIAMPIGALIAGYISDKTMHIRYLALVWTIVAGLSLLALSALPWWVFTQPAGIKTGAVVFWSAFMYSMGGIIPLINVSYLQNGFDSEKFGRVRLFGTLGFAFPNAFFSFSGDLQPDKAIFLSGIFMIFSVFVLFILPEGRISEEASHITLKKAWKLLRAPLFVFFLCITLFFYFSFSAAEYVVSNFILEKIQSRGILERIHPVYFIWFLGTVVEIVFFSISPWIIRLGGPLFLIALGLIAGALRFELNVFFDNDYLAIFSQALHGIQFAGCYLGALLYLKQKTNPARLATAQALYTTFGRAIGTGGGSFFLGNLAGIGAYTAVFHLAGGASLFAGFLLFLFVFYERRYDRFTYE